MLSIRATAGKKPSSGHVQRDGGAPTPAKPPEITRGFHLGAETSNSKTAIEPEFAHQLHFCVHAWLTQRSLFLPATDDVTYVWRKERRTRQWISLNHYRDARFGGNHNRKLHSGKLKIVYWRASDHEYINRTRTKNPFTWLAALSRCTFIADRTYPLRDIIVVVVVFNKDLFYILYLYLKWKPSRFLDFHHFPHPKIDIKIKPIWLRPKDGPAVVLGGNAKCNFLLSILFRGFRPASGFAFEAAGDATVTRACYLLRLLSTALSKRNANLQCSMHCHVARTMLIGNKINGCNADWVRLNGP